MPNDLSTLGYSCALFQRDPRLIKAMLDAARVKPTLTLDGVAFYNATDMTAAVELLAKTEVELDARDRAEAEAPGGARGMKSILLSVANVEIQAAASDAAGKPPRVSIVAYTGGTMRPPGWPELAIDLAGANLAGDIPILAGHGEGLDDVAGQGRAEVLRGQLLVHGALTSATSAGQRVIALSRDGVHLQASIGYTPETSEHLSAGQVIELNGQKITAGPRGLTIIRKGRLREVSLLPIGADSGTSVSVAAKGNPQMITDGLTTDEQVNASLEAQLPENQPNLPEPMRVQARWQRETWADPHGLPKQRAERAMIAASAGQIGYSDFERVLLTERLRDSEVARIRAERPQAPAIHSSSRDCTPDVLRCAFSRLGRAPQHREVLPAASSRGRGPPRPGRASGVAHHGSDGARLDWRAHPR